MSVRQTRSSVAAPTADGTRFDAVMQVGLSVRALGLETGPRVPEPSRRKRPKPHSESNDSDYADVADKLQPRCNYEYVDLVITFGFFPTILGEIVQYVQARDVTKERPSNRPDLAKDRNVMAFENSFKLFFDVSTRVDAQVQGKTSVRLDEYKVEPGVLYYKQQLVETRDFGDTNLSQRAGICYFWKEGNAPNKVDDDVLRSQILGVMADVYGEARVYLLTGSTTRAGVELVETPANEEPFMWLLPHEL